MTDERLLPEGFESLEPFVAYWDRSSFQERWEQRAAAPMAEIRRFYEATLAVSDRALKHLDGFELNAMPADTARLSRLMLSLVNASIAVELHGQPRAPNSAYPHRVRMLHGARPYG